MMMDEQNKYQGINLICTCHAGIYAAPEQHGYNCNWRRHHPCATPEQRPAKDRLSRIEARFERLIAAYIDCSAMAWDFEPIWQVAEQAEDFLDSKRGK